LGDVAGLQQRDMVTYNVELAVYEACTNIVEHAYGKAGGRIEVTVTLASLPNRLIVDLVDFGVGFDLAAIPDPDLDVPKVHGYGLFLVRELMDEVIYHPEAGQNHWRLIKDLVVSG
jgi:serine/threonine-protein kinase RsbW